MVVYRRTNRLERNLGPTRPHNCINSQVLFSFKGIVHGRKCEATFSNRVEPEQSIRPDPKKESLSEEPVRMTYRTHPKEHNTNRCAGYGFKMLDLTAGTIFRLYGKNITFGPSNSQVLSLQTGLNWLMPQLPEYR